MQRRFSRAMVVVAGVLAAWMAAQSVAAQDAPGDVWVISTRGAPRCGRVDSAAEQIVYWQLQAGNRWHEAKKGDFHKRDGQPVPTTFYVHGNRMSRTEAIESEDVSKRTLQRI